MLIIAAGTAHAQIINGGFEDRTPLPASEGNCVTGEARGRFAPNPWVRTNTPDYNTEREIGFSVNYEERTNLAGFDVSPSGGCFQSMRNSEGATQDIVIADASEELKFTYEYTEYTRPGFAQCTPNIEFRINSTSPSTGIVVGSAPNVGTADGPAAHGSWVITETPPFTPSNFGVADGDTFSIYFGSNSTCINTWGYVDGIALISAAAIIEATDNDFTNTPFTPGLAGSTGSVFGNDTVNGAAFAPADVSVSIIDDGRLYGATINADGTIDVPTGTVPGIYQIEYEICDVNDPTNCDTAIAIIAVQTTTADVLALPQQCGGWTTQGWLTYGPRINDVNVMFNSGNYVDDPYLYEPIERDAQGRIVSYMGTPDETGAGAIPDRPGSNLITTSQNDPAHMSEYHRFVHRLGGAPNSSETIIYDTVSAAEFTAYWIEDNAGNVLDSSDFRYTRALNGPGESFPITINYPADGEVFLHSAIFDPTAGYGRPVLEDYECPEPSLSMEKVADSAGPHNVGDVVTYTYTVTNDGNTVVRDILITDTHNGSDPAPVPGNETLLTDVAPTGDSTDAATDNSWDVLGPGDTLTFTGTYTVTVADVSNL